MNSGAFVFFFLTAGVVAYLFPAIVARVRGQANMNAVFIVNLFLGWTFLGWVVALAMAVSGAKAAEAK